MLPENAIGCRWRSRSSRADGPSEPRDGWSSPGGLPSGRCRSVASRRGHLPTITALPRTLLWRRRNAATARGSPPGGAAVEQRLLPGGRPSTGCSHLDGHPASCRPPRRGQPRQRLVPPRRPASGPTSAGRSRTRPGSQRARSLPVAVVLHGYGGTHAAAFGGGTSGSTGIWPRTSRPAGPASPSPRSTAATPTGTGARPGEDAGAMVVGEFLPLLADRGLDVARIGLLGWSMGAFGALRSCVAARLDAVAAVAAEAGHLAHAVEPRRSRSTIAADFARTPCSVASRRSTGSPCGSTAGRATASTRPRATTWPGSRRPCRRFRAGWARLGYWRRMAPAQIAHLGRHLP